MTLKVQEQTHSNEMEPDEKSSSTAKEAISRVKRQPIQLEDSQTTHLTKIFKAYEEPNTPRAGQQSSFKKWEKYLNKHSSEQVMQIAAR